MINCGGPVIIGVGAAGGGAGALGAASLGCSPPCAAMLPPGNGSSTASVKSSSGSGELLREANGLGPSHAAQRFAVASFSRVH